VRSCGIVMSSREPDHFIALDIDAIRKPMFICSSLKFC
jgi:hypothetical protein